VVERGLVVPRNVRAPEQQEIRSNFARVTGGWEMLTSQQRAAWRVASANSYTTTRLGRQVALNPYNILRLDAIYQEHSRLLMGALCRARSWLQEPRTTARMTGGRFGTAALHPPPPLV
jgi:hypothetical protein